MTFTFFLFDRKSRLNYAFCNLKVCILPIFVCFKISYLHYYRYDSYTYKRVHQGMYKQMHRMQIEDVFPFRVLYARATEKMQCRTWQMVHCSRKETITCGSFGSRSWRNSSFNNGVEKLKNTRAQRDD